MDWKTILSDRNTYGDDVQITINGQAVTLGALRQHNEATKGETMATLTQRQSELDARDAQVRNAQTKLAEIVEGVSRATGLTLEQMLAGETPAAAAAAGAVRREAAGAGVGVGADGQIDWNTDPIYSPVQRRLAPIEGTINQQTQALRAGLRAMQEDRAVTRFLLWKQEHPEAKVKLEDAVKLAVDKNYKDEFGFPNVQMALDEIAQPSIAADREKKIREEAMAEGEAKARAEMMGGVTQPAGAGTAGMEFEPASANGKVPTIAEQLSKAFNDPAMLTGVRPN